MKYRDTGGTVELTRTAATCAEMEKKLAKITEDLCQNKVKLKLVRNTSLVLTTNEPK